MFVLAIYLDLRSELTSVFPPMNSAKTTRIVVLEFSISPIFRVRCRSEIGATIVECISVFMVGFKSLWGIVNDAVH